MNQYLKAIREREKQIIQLQGEIEDFKNAWVSACHPLSVGDVVECGYYRKESEMVIDNIRIDMNTHYIYWDAEGFIIKKDGTPGKQRASWSQRIEEV